VRRLLTFAAGAAVSLVLLATPVGAVTYGEPDNGEHPYVGLVVFYNGAGKPLHRCSGTLLSSTVFLTAGHCTYGTASAQVWLDEHVTPAGGYPFSGGVTGTPVTHPLYDGFASFPATHDVGVVVLGEPAGAGAYGTLPALGFLDGVGKRQSDQLLTVVGYGLQGVKPDYSALRDRYKGTVMLVNLKSALTDGFNLQMSGDGGKAHSGGACFGDSGGPVFYGTSTVIVGVNSFVLNANCKGSGFAYRTDIGDSQSFISSFLD